MNDLPFYTTDQAAKKLGVTYQTLMRNIRNGKIGTSMIGNRYVLTDDQIEGARRSLYADGLTHAAIARLYGKKRTTVVYYFQDRMKVKPIGVNNRARGAAVYDQSTVEKAAALLRWKKVNQK